MANDNSPGDNRLLTDGTFDFSGGQNAAFDATRIPANCYASGINISSDRSVIRPRWGWKKLKLDFSETGNYTRKNKQVVTLESVFKTGRFQAFFPYSLGNIYYTGVVVAGIIFLVEQRTRKVTALNVDDPLLIDHVRVNWSDAGNYFTLFDFPNYPMILDGLTARRADPAKNEIPISVLGAYNQNRLFISNAGQEFTGGDPAGSTATPDAPITFNEVIQASSPFVGDVYQLPTSTKNDTITAMGFLQVVDTSTGIGPLLIATNKAIYSYATQQPRTQWLAGQFGSVILYNSGIVGQRAFTNINSDLLFMSPDGQIRALSMSRDEQRRWANSPISREVQNILKFIDPDLAKFSALAYYKNKMFATVNPYRTTAHDLQGNIVNDIAFGGFAVMEMDTTASLTTPGTPVWAGLWTGLRPMDMCQNNEIGYIMSKDPDSVNEMYQIMPNRTWDEIDGKDRYVDSRLYTKTYTWGNETATKQITNLALYLQNIEETICVDTAYKPSHASTFQHWKFFKHVAPVQQCGVNIYPQGLAPQSIRDLPLGSVDDSTCNPVSKDLYSVVKKAQLRIDITGKKWELTGIEVRVRGMPSSDDLSTTCDDFEQQGLLNECNDDWSINYGNEQCNNRCGKIKEPA